MSEDRAARARPSELIASVGLGVAYYVAEQLSLRLALVEEDHHAALARPRPPSLDSLVRGRRLWPGVAPTAFAVNLPGRAGTHEGRRSWAVPVPTSAG